MFKRIIEFFKHLMYKYKRRKMLASFKKDKNFKHIYPHW